MPTMEQDTEITLGTGRMLAIFFGLVLICAFFFAVGFSLGRKTAGSGTGSLLGTSTFSPSAIVRPSAAKNNGTQPSGQTSDFGFYKAVGEKTADTGLTPAIPEAHAASTGAPGTQIASSPASADTGSTGSSGAGSTGGGSASPGTATAAPAQSDPAILSISKDEKLFLDNKPVELSNLKRALQEMLAASPNRSLALSADKAAPFGVVVSVMDILKEANVRNVPAFTEATQP